MLKIWNELHHDLKEIPTLNMFKTRTHACLLEKYETTFIVPEYYDYYLYYCCDYYLFGTNKFPGVLMRSPMFQFTGGGGGWWCYGEPALHRTLNWLYCMYIYIVFQGVAGRRPFRSSDISRHIICELLHLYFVNAICREINFDFDLIWYNCQYTQSLYCNIPVTTVTPCTQRISYHYDNNEWNNDIFDVLYQCFIIHLLQRHAEIVLANEINNIIWAMPKLFLIWYVSIDYIVCTMFQCIIF